jgi:hypothetical protein
MLPTIHPHAHTAGKEGPLKTFMRTAGRREVKLDSGVVLQEVVLANSSGHAEVCEEGFDETVGTDYFGDASSGVGHLAEGLIDTGSVY